MTGTWVLYLPHVKNKFGINDAEIGIALFCLAMGLLFSIPFIPYVNKKIGVGNSTKFGIILFALAFNLPLLASSYVLLCSCLFLTGFFSGFTDVSMNALVSTIEKKDNAYFMSAAHGFFSLGGFIGAGIGSLLLPYINVPFQHMLGISIIIIISNVLLSKHYVAVVEEKLTGQDKTSSFSNFLPLFGLAMVAFIIMLNEGAVEHWSNLFLFDVVQVTESKAGLGFIAFSLCMTIGRFLGDGISKRFGTILLLSMGCCLAIIAYCLVIVSNLITAVVGFGLLGFGLSVIVPELFRLAGQTKDVPASVGISIVSGIGFAGFLAGPVILGFISDQTNLTSSFYFLGASIVIAFIFILVRLRK